MTALTILFGICIVLMYFHRVGEIDKYQREMETTKQQHTQEIIAITSKFEHHLLVTWVVGVVLIGLAWKARR